MNSTENNLPAYEEWEKILSAVRDKNYDLEKIERAYAYAARLHEGQYRLSGEAYIHHPLSVAAIVAGLQLDTDAICAALLHDTVEDCSDKTSLDEIRRDFGDEVAKLVDGLTKIPPMQTVDKEATHLENLRKMLLAMAKDIRVIFIKLCDRLHNMRTLSAKGEERQREIALETMHIYAPIADRLGMQFIKQELENLSLYYLDSIGYKEVADAVEKRYGQSRECMDEAQASLKKRLTDEGLTFEINGRVKSISSLYRKMFRQNRAFEDIYDFYAIRVLVNTDAECYLVLGLVHEMYKSVPGRFKDYISTPKSNMYRSLHTTVIGRGGVPFEVQIRTFEMHQVAEYGIAAHWKYKSGQKSSAAMDKELQWISKLLENNAVSHDVDEVINSFKVDLFHDETFVFTPKGDLISIPFLSNAIDFAYAIHSAVGNRMIGAKVNGIMVPIDRTLENGDVVEILTGSADKGPSRDWLKIVKTSEARDKIRQWFKKEKRADNILLGHSEIEKELDRHGRPYTEEERDVIVSNVAKRIGFADMDDLYNAIGYGGIHMAKIANRLRDELERTVKAPVVEAPLPITPAEIPTVKRKKSNHSGVIIDGLEGCAVKFARCCNPLPGDPIVGFITKGFGVSVHTESCPNVRTARENSEMRGRLVSAEWESTAGTKTVSDAYEAALVIRTADAIGVLADISKALADMKVGITAINSHRTSDCAIINLTVSCKNTEHYQTIVQKLRAIPTVVSVERGFC